MCYPNIAIVLLFILRFFLKLNLLLQEAEEESDDSSEEDIELEFDEKAKISKLKVLNIFLY